MTLRTGDKLSVSSRRSGTTVAEVLVCLVLVSGLLVVAMDLLSSSAKGQQHMADRARAQALAYDLMSEIMRQAYENPDSTPVFGPESDETSSGDRSSYDDVDDYDNWSALPPQYKDGTDMADFTDWRRTVYVDWVLNDSLNTVQGLDTGAERITVKVEMGGVKLASLTAVKTGASNIRTPDIHEGLP
ncbi:MAG: hypothetical protein JSU63_21975 [Phycisphaerales bacterium]|nr:MAG: hypothetical protein JSU63_21975 [Phycisphaerales bacterium]